MIIQGSTPMLAILKAASPRRYSHLDPGAGLRGLFILFPLPRVLRGCARSRMFASTGLAALLFAGVAQAAQPMLKELAPPGAQRGKTFTLTVKGEGVTAGAEMITTLPATISRLAPPKDVETPETQLSFLVQLHEDAPVGVYPVRIRTDDGLSNVLVFSVGDLPEVSEKEPNNSMGEAQQIVPPITVSGYLKLADQDFYRFSAKAGQRLVLEVEARRMGSAIDPVLEVLNSAGHRVAYNDDAPGLGVDSRVEVTFPKTGTYYAVVHDSKYNEQPITVYRLKIGSYAYADGIFPLGWQRGKSVDVTFIGGNLGKPVKVRATLDVPPDRQSAPINLPGPRPLGSLPFQFQVSDYPEVIAPLDGSVMELKPETVVNGRIGKRGQVDRYQFKVAPGQKWLVSLEAASLGTSQLYGQVTVSDPEGKKLSTRDVGKGTDPELAFTVPEKVNEVVLAVADVRGLGGPTFAYRLLATPGSEDFALKIVTPYVNIPARGTAAIEVAAERHGYDGPIQLSVPDLPDDFALAGGNIAAEVINYEGKREPNTIGYVTITAKPEAKARAFQITLWGQGGPPDHPIRRRAECPGLIFTVNGEEQYSITADLIPPKPVTYPWLGIGLPVSLRKPPPAMLEVAAKNVRAVQAMDFPVQWKVLKQGSGIVTKSVGGLQLPTVKDLVLDDKSTAKGADEGNLILKSTLDTPLVKFDLVPSATIQIGGQEETLVGPAVTVELVRAYTLALSSDRVEVKNGGKVELAGVVQREPVFAGTVKVRIDDPPDKISCPAIEVPNGQSDFRITCEAAAGAQEGNFEIHLVSSATIPGRTDKREYTYPPLAARMIVAAEKPEQRAANKAL